MSEPVSDDPHDLHASKAETRAPLNSPAEIELPLLKGSGQLSQAGEPAAHRTHVGGDARGDQGGIAGTAERIGSAFGSARRHLRRGLQLVHRPAAAQPVNFSTTWNAEGSAEQWASHVIREGIRVEGEVDAFHRAAQQMNALSEEAVERVQLFRSEISSVFVRSRERAERIVAVYPLQTIAAIAGIGFAAGVALRLSRRSHRG